MSLSVPKELANRLRTVKRAQVDDWESVDVENVQFESDFEQEVATKGEDDEFHEFPLVIVNLSKLAREHGGVELVKESDFKELAEKVRGMFTDRCVSMSEELFDQQLAFHSTYGHSKALLADLKSNHFPKDVFCTMDYPVSIQNTPLHVLLSQIEAITPWKSVNMIKFYLKQTSRDIIWKANIALELEVLAQEHQIWHTSEKRDQDIELNQLMRLRRLFLDRLAHDLDSGTRRALVERIEQVDKDVAALLVEIEADPLEDMSSTTILDRILDMIFQRIIYIPFQIVQESRQEVRKLWIREFGKLPPSVTVPQQQPTTTTTTNESFACTGAIAALR